MTALDAETKFAEYLDFCKIQYTRNYIVDGRTGRNVDFHISSGSTVVLADVKGVFDIESPTSEILAYKQIKSDIGKLRRKFASLPSDPVVLVTVNCSKMFFTGYTVMRSMFGSPEVNFSVPDMNQLTPLQFTPRGGASFTRSQNTTISAILIFDHRTSNVLLTNPFARVSLPASVFPNTREYHPARDLVGNEILEFTKLHFDGHYFAAT